MRRSVPLVLMAVTLAGCAAGGAHGAAPARLELAPTRTSALQIGTGELAMARHARNALVALEQLRPGYRQTLGSFTRWGEPAPPPTVFINDAYAGPIDVLEAVPVDQVADVRMIRPMEAMQRYGEHMGRGGVILVTQPRDVP
jgi:hypothetical protein